MSLPQPACAALPCEGGLYAARATGSGFGRALWRLVDGLYGALGPDARLLLRGRILCTAPPDAFDWGLVKVAARRIAVVEALPPLPIRWVEPPPWTAPPWLPPGWRPPAALGGDAAALEALAAMEALVPREGQRWALDRPLAALLADERGEVVGWGWNRGSRFPTRHAELAALATARAPGQVLWCSRKPCRLCAGALATLLPPGAEVRFRDPDPGRQARATALDPGSEDARRFGPPRVVQRRVQV